MDPPTATGGPPAAAPRGGGTLGFRLLVLCAIAGVLIVGPLIVSWWSLRDVHLAEHESSLIRDRLSLTRDLDSAAVDVQGSVDAYVVFPTPQFRTLATTHIRTAGAVMGKVEASRSGDPYPVELAGALRMARDYVAARDDLVATVPRDPAEARRRISTVEGLAIGRVREVLAERIDKLQERAGSLSATGDRNVHRSRILLGGAALVVPLVIITILVFASSWIVRPVRKVSHTARMIAAGDHSVRVGKIGRGETADLARAFDTMVDEIDTASRQIKAQNLRVQREKEQSDRERAITEAVLQATPTAICLVDPAGQVLVANRSVHDLPAEALRPTTADVAGGHFDEYVDATSGRTFRRYVASLALDHGQAGHLLVIHETTAETAADKAKADFVMTVSHELRTPLAAVLGYAELLARRELDHDTRTAYAEMIHDQARQLDSLVTALLDLRVAEEGGLGIVASEFDIVALLREKRELFMGHADSHSLSVTGAEGPLLVVADRDRIGQAVSNLVSNAIKYSPDGGVIRLSAEMRAGRVRVAVQDGGVGIPAAERRRVFERFVRLEGAPRVGGTGLGLAIVDEIVREHGGEVGVVSEPGRGSTFWFELPPERVVGNSPAAAAMAPGDR